MWIVDGRKYCAAISNQRLEDVSIMKWKGGWEIGNICFDSDGMKEMGEG